VINGAVSAIGDHYHVGATGLGFTVSSALLGAAGGAFVAGRVADRFGRLMAIRLAAALFLITRFSRLRTQAARAEREAGLTGGAPLVEHQSHERMELSAAARPAEPPGCTPHVLAVI
jgi:MFS family permease